MYQDHNSHDIRVFRRGLLLLLASIGLVYFVYVSLHGDKLVTLAQHFLAISGGENINSKDVKQDGIGEHPSDSQILQLDDQNTGVSLDTPAGTLSDADSKQPDQSQSNPQTGTQDRSDGGAFALDLIQSFSGMTLRNGKNPIVQTLGLRYQYALKDKDNMYFFFLGSRFYDFKSILSELGGNIVEITNQKDILSNGLFADKVTYLKLATYKNKVIILVLQQGINKWLIIVPHNIYYKKQKIIYQYFKDKVDKHKINSTGLAESLEKDETTQVHINNTLIDII